MDKILVTWVAYVAKISTWFGQHRGVVKNSLFLGQSQILCTNLYCLNYFVTFPRTADFSKALVRSRTIWYKLYLLMSKNSKQCTFKKVLTVKLISCTACWNSRNLFQSNSFEKRKSEIGRKSLEWVNIYFLTISQP